MPSLRIGHGGGPSSTRPWQGTKLGWRCQLTSCPERVSWTPLCNTLPSSFIDAVCTKLSSCLLYSLNRVSGSPRSGQHIVTKPARHRVTYTARLRTLPQTSHYVEPMLPTARLLFSPLDCLPLLHKQLNILCTEQAVFNIEAYIHSVDPLTSSLIPEQFISQLTTTLAHSTEITSD